MTIEYGLSTSWCSSRHHDGNALLEELLATEIPAFELDYRITADMAPVIVKGILKHNRNVLSLHHPFPHPEILDPSKVSGDAILLSSLDETERVLGVKYAIRTIQRAHDLEANAVVFHLGHVNVNSDQNDWLDQYDRDQMNSDASKQFIEKRQQERHSNQPPHFDAVLKSLDAIHEEAIRLNIRMGIENRYFPDQIPNHKEIGLILDEFEGGNIGYWHDCGHAQASEAFGLDKHVHYLEAYGAYLVGTHLHDCLGYNDHKPPGQGTIDYKMIQSYLKKDTIRILEVHHATLDELYDGINVLTARGIV
ncbi:TIM barrel protein [candidate division KSB1 bacterium]|nr:TIM barrel protein [candidate division KSB1 bacterium]